MKDKIKIAAAQLYSDYDNSRENFLKIKENVKKAKKNDAKIIAFSELFYCGNDEESVARCAESKYGELCIRLAELARQHDIIIICGYAEKTTDQGKLYNSAICIDNTGKIVGNHRKVYLNEHEGCICSEGEAFEIIHTEYCDIGILIGEEVEYPEPARILAMSGVQMIFVISSMTDVRLYGKYLSALALQNQLYIVNSNEIGNDKRGMTRIFNDLGMTVAEGSMKWEELIFAEICLKNESRQLEPHYYDFNPETLKQCLNASK